MLTSTRTESSGKAPNLAEKNVGTSMADLQSQFAAAKVCMLNIGISDVLLT